MRFIPSLLAVPLLLLSLAAAQARDYGSEAGVTAEQLLDEPLAGEAGKQVVGQLYSFPVGAVLPWHIHADAQEIAYVVEGDFAIEIEGEGRKQLKAGQSFYLKPNQVHRGMNIGSTPVKLFVLRIKPKDQPLVTEVPGPSPTPAPAQ